MTRCASAINYTVYRAQIHPAQVRYYYNLAVRQLKHNRQQLEAAKHSALAVIRGNPCLACAEWDDVAHEIGELAEADRENAFTRTPWSADALLEMVSLFIIPRRVTRRFTARYCWLCCACQGDGDDKSSFAILALHLCGVARWYDRLHGCEERAFLINPCPWKRCPAILVVSSGSGKRGFAHRSAGFC